MSCQEINHQLILLVQMREAFTVRLLDLAQLTLPEYLICQIRVRNEIEMLRDKHQVYMPRK